MLYAILCYDNQDEVCAWSKEHDDEVIGRLQGVMAKLAEAKRLGPVARLEPTTAAKTIRKGKTAKITDGPFAETKEQLLGFYIVECATPDAAMETANELARASGSAGAFEVRPLKAFFPAPTS
jgi:hypothetical protein